MALYVAIINTPGYLPQVDPYYADSIGEAWSYLADEYEQCDEVNRETWQAMHDLSANEVAPANGEPYNHHIRVTMMGHTLAYCVTTVACSWFARCDRAATHLRSHPTLSTPGSYDGIPCCDRCAGIAQQETYKAKLVGDR